jgi:acyl-CoA thioesterase I
MLARAVAVTALLMLMACAPDETDPAESPDSATPTPVPPPAVTPSPEPTPQEDAEGSYLALGDSLAVGVGADDPEQGGYVPLIFEALSEEDGPFVGERRISELWNLAVSGETSASMRDGGQLDEAQERIAQSDPPVSLVTLDIGGNDLLALVRAEPCASDPDGDPCREQIRQTLDGFERNYRLILGTLVEVADRQEHDVVVAVMTYFNPFSGTEHAYEVAGDRALLGVDGLLDCDAADASPEARGMNDIIACVAIELGARVVDVEPRFLGRGEQLTHILAEDIHTNDEGHREIADAFLEELER